MNKLPLEIIKIIIEYENKSTIVITSLNKLFYSLRKHFCMHINYDILNNLKTEFKIVCIYNVHELPILNNNKEILQIKFSETFNKNVDNLPENITHLTFDWVFNNKVDNLPKNITHLVFGKSFNKAVDNLPIHITHLTFGNNFNRKTNNLPKNITHLTFGENFNQKVNNLPICTTHLTFGRDFNQETNNLPKNITHLTFGNNFNQNINNLPEKITNLIFGNNFNKKINKLPENIIYLTLRIDDMMHTSFIEKRIIFSSFEQGFSIERDHEKCTVYSSDGTIHCVSTDQVQFIFKNKLNQKKINESREIILYITKYIKSIFTFIKNIFTRLLF